MTSSTKGAARERELVNRFLDAGWGALRLGASGSGGDADLPDVLAGRPVVYPWGENRRILIDDYSGAQSDRFASDLFAVELKSGKATTLYVEQPEVDALERFAQQLGARPLLGARYTTQGSGTETYLVPPERARGPTDSGLYGLPVDDIDERSYAVVREGGAVEVNTK